MFQRRSRGACLRAAATAATLAATAAVVAPGATAAAPPTLNVAVNASSITVSGSPQAGAVNIVTSVTGVKEGGTILVLLNPGATPAQLYALMASKSAQDPNHVAKIGSIVFDQEGPAGQQQGQTTLAPGHYVALATAGEGPPKFHTEFTVAPSAAPAALPPAAAVEKTIDFGFRGPKTLSDGEVVRFENEGFVVHMDVAFPVRNQRNAFKLVRYLLKGQEKLAAKVTAGPPVVFHGPLSTGAFQQETITARPGWYVQACFMDTEDGRVHTRLGMERIIKITG